MARIRDITVYDKDGGEVDIFEIPEFLDTSDKQNQGGKEQQGLSSIETVEGYDVNLLSGTFGSPDAIYRVVQSGVILYGKNWR